jgi:hypothetical protein
MDWMVRSYALTFSALTPRCRFLSPSAPHAQTIESHNLAIAEWVRVCRRQVRVSNRQPAIRIQKRVGLPALPVLEKQFLNWLEYPTSAPRTELPRSHRDEISDPSPCGCTRVGRLRLQVDKYQKARLRTLMSAPLLGARLHETGGAAGVFPTRSNGLT